MMLLVKYYKSHFFYTLRKKRPYSEIFWCFPAFSISPYSLRMQENADQNNSEYGHFSRSDKFRKFEK